MSAGTLVVLGRLVAKLGDFVILLLLARLLVPADFGLIAIALSIVQIAEAVFQVPVMQGLVRGTEPGEQSYATAFTLAAIRGLLLALVLTSLAWPLSQLYQDDRLFPLIVVLSLAPVARGLLSPRLAYYMRRMNYWREFTLEVSGKFVAVIVGVIIGYIFKTYWALAAATLTAPVFMLALSYVLAPYMPRISFKSWSRFSDIVVWSSLGQIVAALNWQMDKLVLGKWVSTSSLGQYTVAFNLSVLMQQTIVQPMTKPLLSSASTKSEEMNELKELYINATSLLVLGVGPILVFLSFYADPIVAFAFGEKWNEAVPYLKALSLIAIGAAPIWVMPPLAIVLKKTRLTAFRLWLEFLLKLPVLIIGVIYFGIWGAIAARGLSIIFVLIITVITIKNLIGLSIYRQLNAIFRPVLSLLPMAGFLYFSESYIGELEAGLSLAIFIAGGGLISFAIYVLSVACWWYILGKPRGGELMALNIIRR